MSTDFSGQALRHLRALGHELDPVVQIGKNGITPELVKQTNAQLLAHELVKIRVATEAPLDRKEAAEQLALETKAVLAQVLGRTFLLYKKPPAKDSKGKARKPKITLPA